MGEGRVRRLHECAFHNGEAMCSDAFSMHNHGLVSSTGWQGRAPPKKTQEELKELYRSGQICEYLGVFFPIPYSMPPQ
jgi:hypothetical protein